MQECHLYFGYYCSSEKNFVLVIPASIVNETMVQVNNISMPFLQLRQRNPIHRQVICNELEKWKKTYPQYILHREVEIADHIKIIFRHSQNMEP